MDPLQDEIPSLDNLEGFCLAFDPDNDDLPLPHVPIDLFKAPNLLTLRYHAPQYFEEEEWGEFGRTFLASIDSMGCRESVTRLIGGFRCTHSPKSRVVVWKDICEYLPNLTCIDAQADGYYTTNGDEIYAAVRDTVPTNKNLTHYIFRLHHGFYKVKTPFFQLKESETDLS